MIAKLKCQKWHRRAIDFRLRWSMSKISSAKKLHLFLSDVYHRRGFLFCMNAEASEESRKPDHLESCLLRPQHEGPVNRITKGFVDWSSPSPYVRAPDHSFCSTDTTLQRTIPAVTR